MYYKALQFFFSLKIQNCIIIKTIPGTSLLSLSQLMPVATLNVKVVQGPSPGCRVTDLSYQPTRVCSFPARVQVSPGQ